MTIDPVKLTQELVRYPSITPRDEGVQKILIDLLEARGFECHILPFGDIINFYARRGSARPHICFCGHTDVVPPGDETSWTHPPFDAVIDDGVLYGRGVSDMKGNIACFMAALDGFLVKHDGFAGSISLLITGDEEGMAVNGTVKVLEWMKDNDHIPDMALVGEPSNPRILGEEIKSGRRGSLSGILTVVGAQGHVAYPQRADNPLPRMVKLLDVLSGYEFDQGNDSFQPTNLEITTIDTGNVSPNVIPEKVTAKFNIRFNNNWTMATLAEKIREILDGIALGYELETYGNAEAFLTSAGALTDITMRAVQEITGRTPEFTTNGGTSDARFVTNYCPVVEFGLTNESIHKIDERARVKDIYDLSKIYYLMLEHLFIDKE